MAGKRRTHQNSETKKPTTPVPQTQAQEMFKPRPFGLESEQIAPPQQPLDLKTELMRAERYGHNLTQMQWAEPAPATPVQPKEMRGQPLLQAKLAIGEPGDKYEQEADRVASQVVQQINAPAPQQLEQSQSVQREAMPDEEELMKKSETGTIQREEEPQEDEELQMKPAVQLQASGGGMAATDELENDIQQAKGGGQALAEHPKLDDASFVSSQPQITSTLQRMEMIQCAIPADKKAALALTSGHVAKKPATGLAAGQRAGGFHFGNYQGKLDTKDSSGNPITYKEYDVNSYNGIRRDAERIVHGSDGRIYHTGDHYNSFTEIT